LLEPRPHVLDLRLADVPLREHDEGRVVRLARDVCDREILVDQPLARVDEDERDVGTLGGVERAQLGVVLDALTLSPLAAQAGGVDEDERRLAAPEHGVDRVPRRAGHLGDDHALLSENRVQQARLADVRSAENRDPDRLLADLGWAGAWEASHDGVEQVACAVAVQRGKRDRVAEAEAVELERRRLPGRVVDLVREQKHRLVRLPEDLGDLLVAGRDPDLRVDDEEDEIGLLHGRARLVGDRAGDRRGVGDVDSAGVDQPELGAGPLTDELLAVPGDAGGLVHNRGAGGGQSVDERRLADVREAHHGHRSGETLGHD
jgi:hypothetical protein